MTAHICPDVRICPRCKTEKMQEPLTRNALSRRDNQTMICEKCGLEEALVDSLIHKDQGHHIPIDVQEREMKLFPNKYPACYECGHLIFEHSPKSPHRCLIDICRCHGFLKPAIYVYEEEENEENDDADEDE